MPPLGWFLAQGLYPLGSDSSDDEEGACELPNGRIVCGPHGLVICGKCCSDYSSMNDVLNGTGSEVDEDDEDEDDEDEDDEDEDDEDEDDEDEDDEDKDDKDRGIARNSIGPERRRGTGQVIPTKFESPSSVKPTELFIATRSPYMGFARYAHPSDPRKVLIMTDGACLNNGQPNPKAGWAFVYGLHAGQPAVASGRLERRGPFGHLGIQSSNRAELRAVIAALRFRHWPGEGFHTIVIATDSEYVVEGATKWVKNWIRRDWKTTANVDVKNKDLWEMLLGEFERQKEKGLSIQFWRIPREWNTTADAAAKKASEGTEPDNWEDLLGFAQIRSL